MDKLVSILAFPVGLLICFTPIIVVWLREEAKKKKQQPEPKRRAK
jgi:hypothetical protein